MSFPAYGIGLGSVVYKYVTIISVSVCPIILQILSEEEYQRPRIFLQTLAHIGHGEIYGFQCVEIRLNNITTNRRET